MRRICAGALALLFVLLSFPQLAAAQTIESADFTVQAVIPDNQIDKNQSYFDLRMQPGDSQTLTVNIINRSQEAITVDVALIAASTNRNGLIEYQVAVEPDETLRTPFDTIADAPAEITVPADSVESADITIAMPENRYDGAILGGIVFTRRVSNENTEGVSITNRFSYVIGVKLTETDTAVGPDFRLKGIEPTLINYRRAVSIALHNPVALIVKDANVTANIYRKGEATPLFSTHKNSVEMAPNSLFQLPVEWAGEAMEAGDYRAHVKLHYDGRVWEWDEGFVIAADDAKNVNDNAIEAPATDNTVNANWWKTWWWLPVVLAVILILLLWIAFLLGKRRRREDEHHKR